MERGGILVVGASEAATVVFSLTTLGRRYVRCPALTAEDGGPYDHERVSARHLADLRAWAQVVVEFRRGAASFVHDHERLSRIRDAGQLPVVATDEPQVVDALLRESPDWTAVLLWRPDPAGRGPDKAWLRMLHRFPLVVRADRVAGPVVARMVHLAVQMHDEEDRPGATT